MRPRILVWLSGLFLAAAYARALTFSFVIDDAQLIVGDGRIRFLQCLGTLFRSNFFAGSTASGEFYRPLANAWFMLNYALFGLRPAGWHLTSVLLHAAVAVALFFVVNRLFSNALAGAYAALLFAVMPIHAEVVLWLSCAGDELAALFLLLALLLLDRWVAGEATPSGWELWAAAACFSGALFSKELATLFPVIFALLLWQRSAGQTKRNRVTTLAVGIGPMLVADAIFLLARSRVLGRSHIKLGPIPVFLLTLPKMALFYAFKLLWPFQPEQFYDLARSTSASSTFGLWAILFLLLVAAALYVWWKVPRSRVPLGPAPPRARFSVTVCPAVQPRRWRRRSSTSPNG